MLCSAKSNVGSQLGAAKVESEPQNRCFGLQQNPRERERKTEKGGGKERNAKTVAKKGAPKTLFSDSQNHVWSVARERKKHEKCIGFLNG